jgi:hypothetical protein
VPESQRKAHPYRSPFLTSSGSEDRIGTHSNGFYGLFSHHCVHRNKVHPIKANETTGGPQPHIPVAGLQYLVDGLAGEIVARVPGVVDVLIDLLAW